MARFEREIRGYRYVETLWGDDLRRVALRELGDATQWVEIALLNDLRPPYLVNNEGARAKGVAVTGDSLRVPAPGTRVETSTDQNIVFGRDLLADSGVLEVDVNGDFALASGTGNLHQALRHRLQVVKRELGFHPEYGCWVSRLIGHVNGPTAGNLAAFYVRSSLAEDKRVDFVPYCSASVLGDAITVEAEVVPISGRKINISMVL